MSTLPVTNTLTAVFLPIGWAGAILAIICALVALVALARGAAGLTGGAIGVWFIGALVSVVSSFANQWTPLLLSAVALAAALVVGGMARMLTLPASSGARSVAVRPAVASAVDTVPAAPALPAQGVSLQDPRPQAARTQTVKTTGSPVTA